MMRYSRGNILVTNRTSIRNIDCLITNSEIKIRELNLKN